jgi:hypothetical protein
VGQNLVAILGGGGSGHEPAHAGFVGRGVRIVLESLLRSLRYAHCRRFGGNFCIAQVLAFRLIFCDYVQGVFGVLCSHVSFGSADAVLAAILATTGAAGCLMIVKNYTGDRLNFGARLRLVRAPSLFCSTLSMCFSPLSPSIRPCS